MLPVGLLRSGQQTRNETHDRAHAQGDRNFDGDLFDEDRHGSSSD